MAAPINLAINLDVIDSPILEQTQFGPDMDKWLSNVTDIINDSFTTLNNAFSGLIAAQGIDVGGGGAGPLTVTVVGLTASGFVNVNLVSTTNPNISITNVTPGNGSFTVTFNADPGASAIIYYQAFSAQPM